MTVTAQYMASGLVGMISTWHVVIILVAVLILFGGKKLPELARGLGRGLRIFKEEVSGLSGNLKDGLEDDPKPAPPKAQDVPPAANADKPAETGPK
jgi:sec-independent protein translocase protein TatA